jgi:hypothetical protein
MTVPEFAIRSRAASSTTVGDTLDDDDDDTLGEDDLGQLVARLAGQG